MNSPTLIPIIPQDAIYVVHVEGDAPHFATAFAQTWHRLPRAVQGRLLDFWHGTGKLRFPIITLTRERVCQLKPEPYVIVGSMLMDGFLFTFCSSYTDNLPLSPLGVLIAHELAHADNRVSGRTLRCTPPHQTEDAVDRTIRRWGFHPDELAAACDAVTSRLPRIKLPAVEQLYAEIHAARLCLALVHAATVMDP